MFFGVAGEYLSADTLDDDADPFLAPPELLNSLQPQGMPPHRLVLKEGMLVMALRNLNTTIGIANGTRLIVKKMLPNVLECEILTGDRKGQCVFIPRVTLTAGDKQMPFKFRRRQFPVRVAFAMTVRG